MADNSFTDCPVSSPSFVAVDFFCGAGGTTRGLIDAGGYVIAGVDKDARCEHTYVDNNQNATLDREFPRYLNLDIFPQSDDYPQGQQDQLFFELKAMVEDIKSRHPELPLLFAICAPCQPFTNLSKKKLTEKRTIGRSRDRGLLKEAAKFVRHFQPEMVLSENVAGIRDAKYGGVWDDFRDDLEALGYVTGSKVVCASSFGVPQRRKRSILIAARREAVRADRFADLTQTQLLVPSEDPDATIVSVRHALKHLPPIQAGEAHPVIPNHRTRSLSEKNLQRIAAALPGQNNSYMRETSVGDLTLDCHRNAQKRTGTRCFTDVYTRMHPDRPSPTITTKCHSISNGRFGHFDPSQKRGISLREAAILQSFPDDYVFYPEDQLDPAARMIGNAVPPKLAAFYARYLSNTIIV